MAGSPRMLPDTDLARRAQGPRLPAMGPRLRTLPAMGVKLRILLDTDLARQARDLHLQEPEILSPTLLVMPPDFPPQGASRHRLLWTL